MKQKFISIFLSAAILLGALPFYVSAAEYEDVPKTAWYYEAVSEASDSGLFSGVGDGKFEPGRTMTRGEFVKVLSSFTANYQASQFYYSSFSDVATDKWYFAPIQWANRAGIVSGVGNGRFAPGGKVTREQIVAILYRYAKAAGNSTAYDESRLSEFSDKGKISNYAKEAMAWAVTTGLIKGSGGRLNPKSNALRCEVAQIIVNSSAIITNRYITLSPPSQEEQAAASLNWAVNPSYTFSDMKPLSERDGYYTLQNYDSLIVADAGGVEKLFDYNGNQLLPDGYVVDRYASSFEPICIYPNDSEKGTPKPWITSDGTIAFATGEGYGWGWVSYSYVSDGKIIQGGIGADNTYIKIGSENGWNHADFLQVGNFHESFRYVSAAGNAIGGTYKNHSLFREGLCAVQDYSSRKWGYINTSGKVVIPFTYDKAYDFRNGKAAVKKDGRAGYITKDGAQAMPFIFEEARGAYDGKAWVKYNGKWGIAFIDESTGKSWQQIYLDFLQGLNLPPRAAFYDWDGDGTPEMFVWGNVLTDGKADPIWTRGYDMVNVFTVKNSALKSVGMLTGAMIGMTHGEFLKLYLGGGDSTELTVKPVTSFFTDRSGNIVNYFESPNFDFGEKYTTWPVTSDLYQVTMNNGAITGYETQIYKIKLSKDKYEYYVNGKKSTKSSYDGVVAKNTPSNIQLIPTDFTEKQLSSMTASQLGALEIQFAE